MQGLEFLRVGRQRLCCNQSPPDVAFNKHLVAACVKDRVASRVFGRHALFLGDELVLMAKSTVDEKMDRSLAISCQL